MSHGAEVLSRFLSEEQIAALPDQTAHLSWVFEPYLRLRHDNTQNNLDLVLDDVCAAWQETYLRKRSRDVQEKFMECCRVILVNLIRAHVKRSGMSVGIGRQGERLDRERRYRPKYMTKDRFGMCMDWLQNTGYMQRTSKGYKFGENAQTARYALTEKALDALYSDTLSLRDFHIAKRDEPIQLKNGVKQLTKYCDSPETQAMRSNLQEINSALEQVSITTKRQLSYHDFKEDYAGKSKYLYRVFNNGSFEQNGRFYGGWWQHVRKSVRRSILIDGQATVEADFSGFNPAVLLAKARQSIPQDPYALISGVENSPQLREHAKDTLAAYLNGKSLHIGEPRQFDEAAHGMTAQDFRLSVLTAFPMIEEIVGTDAGLRLQREESDLAEQVMLHFVRQGHTILPIHDAFIVQADLKDELVEVMKDKFHSRYGQIPNVKVILPVSLETED